MNQRLTELRQRLEPRADAERAEKMAAYLKTDQSFFGIAAGERKKIANSVKRDYPFDSIEEMLDDAMQVWMMPERECQYIALDWIIAHKAKLTLDHWPMIDLIFHESKWWDTLDLAASHLLGHYLAYYPDHAIKVIEEYTDSGDIWLQRACLLSQLKFKAGTNQGLLSSLIEELQPSDEFFINKAVGWSLREYSKVNKAWVANFIAGRPLSNLAKREASKYLA